LQLGFVVAKLVVEQLVLLVQMLEGVVLKH